MKFILTFLILLVATNFSPAGEKPSDEATKAKLLGYWQSPRHAYLIKSDGVMYMCPRKDAITKEKWDVKEGRFFQGAETYQIVSLTDKKFIYRSTDKDHVTFTLVRTTEKEAEGE